jgi:hypothetical protein
VKICTFEGCDRLINAQGLCAGHRSQVYEGRRLTPLRDKNPNGSYTLCTFDECGRIHLARGYCAAHYAQWKSGSGMRPIGTAWATKWSAPERRLAELYSRVTRNGDCLEYKVNSGSTKRYASVSWKGKSIGVHRLVYTLHYGDDITGSVIHHICGNAACINPEHLQKAQAAENTLEMLSRRDYEAEIAQLKADNARLRALLLERDSACG